MMGHRHFPNSFKMMEMDQSHDRNRSITEQSYRYSGNAFTPDNGSFVYPVDNVHGIGVHSISQWDSRNRAAELCSSSLTRECPQLQQAVSGPPYVPIPHSSTDGSLYLSPEDVSGHAHCRYYCRQNTYENRGGPADPTVGSGNGPFKRKSPDTSGAYERGSIFYNAGSSSSSSMSPPEKRISGYQNIAVSHSSIPHYRDGGISIANEDSLRTVRSRCRRDSEVNQMNNCLSGDSYHYYRSTSNPLNYSGALDSTSVHVDETSRQWNLSTLPPAHGRPGISGMDQLSHQSNQFPVRRSGAVIGGDNLGSVTAGNVVSSSLYVHAPSLRAARVCHGSYFERGVPSPRAGLGYPRVGYEAASMDGGLQSVSVTSSSRYLTPSSSGAGYSNYRNGRPRVTIESFQSISSIRDANGRTGSEDPMLMDHSSFYAGVGTLFDRYRDMRLDIDEMSYEELLALGERIGNVSVGLSEDKISKCLTLAMSSSDQNYEEGRCAICLEDYENGVEVGTIDNCGHSYHGTCIKKWLMMKNVCPICKGFALTDCQEEG